MKERKIQLICKCCGNFIKSKIYSTFEPGFYYKCPNCKAEDVIDERLDGISDKILYQEHRRLVTNDRSFDEPGQNRTVT